MEKWLTEIDHITDEFVSTFDSLSMDQMNWKPNPDTWSIAQNIDHLIIINQTYFPVLQSLHEGTYTVSFHAKMGFVVSFLGKTILQASSPDRKRKMKTFNIWEPGTSEFDEDLLNKFQEHQQQLKEEIENANEFIANGTVIASPANRNIVYKLETAFDIIVSHERRHFEQAKEVLDLIKSEN